MELIDTYHGEEVYTGEEGLLEEVEKIGRMDSFRARGPGFGHPHSSKDAHEILYVRRGLLRMRVDGRVCRASAGQVMIIRPGEVHMSAAPKSMIEPCKFDWLVLSLRPGKPFAGLSLEETNRLLSELRNISGRSFSVSRLVDDYFEQLLAEHGKIRPHRRSAAQWLLRLLLLQLIRDYQEQPRLRGKTRRSRSRMIRRALGWMDRRLMEHFTIRDVARAMGRSVTHFHRRFLKEVGTTPAAYLTERRIQEAKLMLAESVLSITDIAFALGFSSSQYFATLFKKHVGLTPTEYRRQGSQRKSPA